MLPETIIVTLDKPEEPGPVIRVKSQDGVFQMKVYGTEAPRTLIGTLFIFPDGKTRLAIDPTWHRTHSRY